MSVITKETVSKMKIGFAIKVGSLYVEPIQEIGTMGALSVVLTPKRYIFQSDDCKAVEEYLKNLNVPCTVTQITESRIIHETENV